jgi:hypothetical protein
MCLMGASWVQAQGGPRYYTDDPGTPGDHQWEINVAYIPLLTADRSTTRMPDLDINWGWGDRVQLTFEVAWLQDRVSPNPPRYGLSQDAIGVKWRFHGDDPELAVAVFPQVLVNNPTRSVERSIVPPGTSLILPVALSRQIGPVAVNGELGYSFVQSGPNAWLAGVVVGHDRRIRHRRSNVELGAEIYAAGDVGGEVTQMTIGAGLRLEIRAPFVLLAMAGRDVHHTEGSFAGYVGMQLLLPPKPLQTQ